MENIRSKIDIPPEDLFESSSNIKKAPNGKEIPMDDYFDDVMRGIQDVYRNNLKSVDGIARGDLQRAQQALEGF